MLLANTVLSIIPLSWGRLLLAFDRWLLRNFDIYKDPSPLTFLHGILFPFQNNGTFTALKALSVPIEYSKRLYKIATKRSRLLENYRLSDQPPCTCSVSSPATRAEVVLISTSLGRLDSGSISGESEKGTSTSKENSRGDRRTYWETSFRDSTANEFKGQQARTIGDDQVTIVRSTFFRCENEDMNVVEKLSMPDTRSEDGTNNQEKQE